MSCDVWTARDRKFLLGGAGAGNRPARQGLPQAGIGVADKKKAGIVRLLAAGWENAERRIRVV